jgi:hypothetical protein
MFPSRCLLSYLPANQAQKTGLGGMRTRVSVGRVRSELPSFPTKPSGGIRHGSLSDRSGKSLASLQSLAALQSTVTLPTVTLTRLLHVRCQIVVHLAYQ